jgi:hypothetical protein
MPTFLRPDDKPVVQFDPSIEISPFALFRLLSEGETPLLVDARAQPGPVTLRGAIPWPGDDWEPPETTRVVVFDRDGSEAEPIVRRLRAAGRSNVRMLFGGLELYEFALDPQVVGDETFLVTGR